MKFEIKKFDAAGRLGLITHNTKTLETPNILPVVSPFDNIISPQKMYENFHISALFTNAYILYNNKEKAQIAESKGIHSYLAYKGLIATDSGAFQHYMYGNQDDITADEIESFQERISSDFPVILDIPVQLNDSKEIAREKVKKTIKRARENISRRTSSHGAWYGPLHGTRYSDVLKESCLNMNSLDFDVYAVGGIVKAMNDYAFDICTEAFLTVNRYIRKDKPIHMFGLGLPQFFSLAVACGADLMDSAAYVLYAKEGRYFTLEGTKNVVDLQELPCSCPICTSHTAIELASLYKEDKKTKKTSTKGIELIAQHNLYVTMAELRTIRESIRSGSLWDLVEQRIRSHPKLVKAYEKVRDSIVEVEQYVPIEKKKGQFYCSESSFSRPIFYRMTSKVKKFYRISKKSILLLIPEIEESLFNSKFGKDWINYIETKMQRIKFPMELMILSPYFGLIPVDLYGVYPFSQREWLEPNLNMVTNFAFKVILDYLIQNKENIEKILVFNPITQRDQNKTSLFLKDFLFKIKTEKFLKMWGEIVVLNDLELLRNYCSVGSSDSE